MKKEKSKTLQINYIPLNKEQIQQEITDLESRMLEADFWADSARAQNDYKRLEELRFMLTGGSKYDAGPAIVSIFAGAGGDDAEDFVRILFEMYGKYAENQNYTVSTLDQSPNELHGYRSISFEVSGKSAYGNLAGESGVHRLVRKSPFNSKSKRQTSFALVEVVPQVAKTDFEMDESELDISFTKSGGAGGQNVNKRETAVRISHARTGFSVHVSAERTQERNRDLAMNMMRAKLFQKHTADEEKRARGLTIADKVSIEWGNQMRSYIFDPYQMVKDHKLGVDVNQVDKVLAGDLSYFRILERSKGRR